MGYNRYCDHEFARDDASSKVCLKCHKRKDYKQ
jgi:hypothetical protein